MKLFSLLIFVFFISCSTKKISISTKVMEFKTKEYGFIIEAPINWQYNKKQGFDSFVGEISISNNDTLKFDLGYNSSSLTCPFCTEDFEIENNLLKTKEDFEIINKLNAKFVLYKYKNRNEFGLHFDSLWVDRYSDEFEFRNIVKFTVYGKNISKAGQNQMRQVFRTIKFLRFD